MPNEVIEQTVRLNVEKERFLGSIKTYESGISYVLKKGRIPTK